MLLKDKLLEYFCMVFFILVILVMLLFFKESRFEGNEGVCNLVDDV